MTSSKGGVALQMPFEPNTPIFISTQDAGAHELRRVAKELRKQNDATAVNDRAARTTA